MRTFLKLFIFVFILPNSYYLLLNSKFVLAATPKYSVSVEVNYAISPEGITTVTQNYALNDLPKYLIPKEYTISLGDIQTSSIKAFSPNGVLKFSRITASEGAGLKVILNGNDTWTVGYETTDFARRVGRLWEITAPQSLKLSSLVNTKFNFDIPQSFGREIVKNYLYDPANSKTPYQAYDFSLTYYLTNDRPYSALVNIPIVSDSLDQKVFLNDFSPRPENVIVDKSGQWLAKFFLPANSNLAATASGVLAQILTKNEIPKKMPKEFTPVDKNLDLISSPKIGLRVEPPKEITAGLPAKITVHLENYGPNTFNCGIISASAKKIALEQNLKEVGPLPPYSSQAIDFNIKAGGWGQNENDIITVQFGETSQDYQVLLRPFWYHSVSLLVKIILFATSVFVITKVVRRLFFSRFARESHLRGQSHKFKKSR